MGERATGDQFSRVGLIVIDLCRKNPCSAEHGARRVIATCTQSARVVMVVLGRRLSRRTDGLSVALVSRTTHWLVLGNHFIAGVVLALFHHAASQIDVMSGWRR